MRKDHVAEEVLGAYVGELAADAVARIEERLSIDRALRDRLAALQRVTDLVRTAAHATPPADSQATATTHTRTGSASRAGPNDARGERAPAAEPSRTFSRPVVWGIAASFVAALAGALLTVLLLGRDAGVDGWQQHALVFHESISPRSTRSSRCRRARLPRRSAIASPRSSTMARRRYPHLRAGLRAARRAPDRDRRGTGHICRV